MKKWFLFLVLVFLHVLPSLQAQERQHELGLRLSGLQDFDFIYKKSDNGIKFKRYRLAVGDVYLVLRESNQMNFNLAYAQGIEKRKNIGKNVQFIHGWEPGLYVSLNSQGDNFNGTAGVFIGYVLGFQINIGEHFYVNLEAIPSLRVADLFSDNDDDTGLVVNAGFDSNAVALTLSYTFTAPKK